MYIWAKYFCQLVSLQFGSKLNLYVQYSKIEIYLEIRGCDNLNVRVDHELLVLTRVRRSYEYGLMSPSH